MHNYVHFPLMFDLEVGRHDHYLEPYVVLRALETW
jgi:hypothetical protein